ncbi:MAG: hypothetical protein J6T72_04005 [Alphaproteobacteria bacterium]|nr:hypothetical protein [Alphaproteobacteria bacterium]
MKIFAVIILFSGILFVANLANAAGPYEMGSTTIDGIVCRWTTASKKSCYKAEMNKNMKDIMSCYENALNQKKCKDVACVKDVNKRIIPFCCVMSGGQLE